MTNTGTIVWAADAAPRTGSSSKRPRGSSGSRVRFCAPASSPTAPRAAHDALIGLEAGADQVARSRWSRELHGRLPQATILLASRDGSLGFIRAALEAGASDVLSLPLQPDELHKALIRASQSTAPRTPAARSRRRGHHRLRRARRPRRDHPRGQPRLQPGRPHRGEVGARRPRPPARRRRRLPEPDASQLDRHLRRGAERGRRDLPARAPSPATRAACSCCPRRREIEEADTVGHDEVKLALDLLRSQFRYTVVDTRAHDHRARPLAALEASRPHPAAHRPVGAGRARRAALRRPAQPPRRRRPSTSSCW